MLPTSAHTQPLWSLYTWPPVFWQANLRRRPRFVHLATRVTGGQGASKGRFGNTIWEGISNDGDAGFGWDWIEIGDGVVAMSDPMALVTNLQILSESGEVLPSSTAAVHFNQFVRRIPWQEEVFRLLRSA
jgi:hypothetical protein